MTTIKVC